MITSFSKNRFALTAENTFLQTELSVNGTGYYLILRCVTRYINSKILLPNLLQKSWINFLISFCCDIEESLFCHCSPNLLAAVC